jgi:YHS domain-containing protein
MKQTFFAGLLVLGLAACHTQESTPPAAATPAQPATAAQDTAKTYPVSMLDNVKDPFCGMPASAGMEDTIHLNGKVIGFCSKECKEGFLKDPKGHPVTYK